MLFDKETYIRRRARLVELMKDEHGIIVLPGNNPSPCNYPNNAYAPLRQDSTFLYYCGLEREGLVLVIDLDAGREVLYGDDIDIDDIIWYGSVDSVVTMAAGAGIVGSAPMSHLEDVCRQARGMNRPIHFLPPYRFDTKVMLMDLLGLHPGKEQEEAVSMPLRMAVIEMRSVKEPQEIEELERAGRIGYLMHTTAMSLVKPGVTEKYIGGVVDGIAISHGSMPSFPTIFTQHGEIMHGGPSPAPLEAGRLALCDAGAETLNNYCSDNTRTMPVSGRYTTRQREIYDIVVECHDHTLQVAKPGVKWMDVHLSVCRLMATRLKELGLMRGDVDEAVAAGAHAMFLPHGLGHMMGMDVHDMEGLGQRYLGYDNEVQPSTQFGLSSLRLGRRLQEGFVVTDEPGIYFIPALIDDWRKSGHCAEWLDFDRLETYKDFGGIRIEDDILITADGCRYITGEQDRIPYRADDVEAYMQEASIN